MKKLLSALLILTMLVSMVCVSTNAAGYKINVDFKTASMDVFSSQFIAGAFYIENGVLFGYDEARALQSNYEVSKESYQWLTYDSSVTMAVADDDLSENHRVVSLVYCNYDRYTYGLADGVVYMSFVYDIDDGCFRFATGLHGSYGDPEDSRVEIMAPIEREIVDTDSGEEFFTLGMSVDKGRIRCYYNDELIYDFVDTTGEWYIADISTSPFVFWQNGNFLQISDIKIADAGYLYPYSAEEQTTTTAPAGDNNGDVTTTTAATTTSETTTKIVEEIVTNEKGETSVVTKIVTEATTTPKAETNQNKPAGGSSTSTGDATFVVVATLVATLGCALIVRKVSVR